MYCVDIDYDAQRNSAQNVIYNRQLNEHGHSFSKVLIKRESEKFMSLITYYSIEENY